MSLFIFLWWTFPDVFVLFISIPVNWMICLFFHRDDLVSICKHLTQSLESGYSTDVTVEETCLKIFILDEVIQNSILKYLSFRTDFYHIAAFTDASTACTWWLPDERIKTSNLESDRVHILVSGFLPLELRCSVFRLEPCLRNKHSVSADLVPLDPTSAVF